MAALSGLVLSKKSYVSVIAFVLLGAVVVLARGKVVRLTPSNYFDLTDGKIVLIRFFVSPELTTDCTYCSRVAELWDELASKWEDDPDFLVAESEVDCRRQSPQFKTNFCFTNGASLITVKFGDPYGLQTLRWEDWDELEAEDLTKIARDTLKPMCTIQHQKNCNDHEMDQIAEFNAINKADLEEFIRTEELILHRVQYLQTELEWLRETKHEAINSYMLDVKKELTELRWEKDVVDFFQDPSPPSRKTFPLRSAPPSDLRPLPSDGSSANTCSPLRLDLCDVESKDKIRRFESFDSKRVEEYKVSQMVHVLEVERDFDEKCDLTKSTSKKIARDLQAEAEILDAKAKLRGYYLMKAVKELRKFGEIEHI